MGEPVLQFSFNFTTTTCCVCSAPIIIEKDQMRQLRESHVSFFCLRGHSQHFAGETDKEKLERALAAERKRREWAEATSTHLRRSRDVIQGKAKALRERISNGVCPCCKRTFQNLQRHMKSKHPAFTKEDK